MSTASLISSCCNCRREWRIEQDDDEAAVEGPEDGAAVWSVGITVGSAVGASVGSLEGTAVGTNVGLIVE